MQRGGSVITAIFHPILLTLTNLLGGEPANTAIRASTGTWIDNTGIVKTAQVNEPRIAGSREVRNLLSFSEDFSNAAWKLQAGAIKVGAATLDGVTAMEISFGSSVGSRLFNSTGITSGSKRAVFYVRAKAGSTSVRVHGGANLSGNIPIDDTKWWPVTYREAVANIDTNCYLQNNSTKTTSNIYVAKAIATDITGMPANYVPEYVANDGTTGSGRQLFDTESGNTVLNNVVTESTLTHNAGKTSLVNEHGWVITDGGLA